MDNRSIQEQGSNRPGRVVTARRIAVLAGLIGLGAVPVVATAFATSVPAEEVQATNARTPYESLFPTRPLSSFDESQDAMEREAFGLLSAGKLEEGLAVLVAADGTPIHEWPSFEKLPEIAYYQYRLGRTAEARNTLAIADGAFRVFSGVATCVESEKGEWVGVTGLDDLTLAQREDVLGRMCGAIYVGYYDQIPESWNNPYATQLVVVGNLLRQP